MAPEARKLVFLRTAEGNTWSGPELISKLIEASYLRLCVKRIIPIRGGVLVEATDAETNQKFLKSQGIRDAGLIPSAPEARRPQVLLYDVPSGLTEETVVDNIVELNILRGDRAAMVGTFCWETDIKLIHREGPRDKPVTNWVIEVTPQLRAALVRMRRLSIGWRQCRMVDHVRVSRCYRCQRFGHVAKNCSLSDNKRVCAHCGGAGYDLRTCKKRGDAPRCVNCKSVGKLPMKHRADGKDCPA